MRPELPASADISEFYFLGGTVEFIEQVEAARSCGFQPFLNRLSPW
jgi:hypothetical protein